AAELGRTSSELLRGTDVVVYGTTRATNAIVTGRVAKTALLVTEGFRDVLVLKEGGKAAAHDFGRPYPPPYVPRRRTFEIGERVDAEGGVVRALDESRARAILGDLRARAYEAVAVCLLWSIANPAHELRLGALIEEVLPGIPYTLSHRLNPILREYRRASSAAIDASIKPLMQAHLREMEEDLRAAGFDGELLVSTAAGGCADVRAVSERPLHTVRSGPAMAPVAGLAYARQEAAGDTVIVVDTGGTTFDVALIRDGRIVSTQETWLGERWMGHLLGIPAVDVRSVGAGGGSIAWLDPGGLLRVGPQSAGADPGPACYARGGDRPTVTDAAVVLGYLDPEWFLGGRMKLDPAAARAAVTRVAEPLGLGVEETAFSILTVANETMIHAIKEITINEGVSPADAVLVAGGGAAGLGILPIARELGCRSVLVPRTAGALSACGMQFSDLVSEQSASAPARSGSFDAAAVNRALDCIDEELDAFARPLEQRGFGTRTITYTVAAHYAAQVWELDVPLPRRRFESRTDVDSLVRAFHDAHERVFAVRDEASEIEFLRWTGRATLRLAGAAAPPSRESRTEGRAGRRIAWFGLEQPTTAEVWRGGDLAPGQTIAGPAIIEEETSTLVLPPGATARLSPLGCYVVDVGRDAVEEEVAA
ncbi:MAG: N-methylhydantoinase, partial [Candidatus Binatota bacterium]|nr:N-methylhydantoinase [Candidatus Binatota bacterium]